MAIKFEIIAEDSKTGARVGRITTERYSFETPAFMPVATQATVKTMMPKDLEEIGVDIIVSNTYHLHLRPGEKLIEEAGGIHKFMNWKRGILTDSGGFQVHSLADLRKVSEDGVEFKSHIDGSTVVFTPEKVMEIEKAIGADIIMIFDHPSPYPVTKKDAARDVELTLKWAIRAKKHKEKIGSNQALFGIVQGSVYVDLRRRAAEELIKLDFDGYALGGLALGEPKVEMDRVIREITPLLPNEKPRYVMGVGYPEDIVGAVMHGVDMFDCVLPTRNGRTGSLFTSEGKLVIKNAKYSRDFGPPDPKCDCYVCRNFTRSYIRHLFNTGEVLAAVLSTYHNIYFYISLMRKIREAIKGGYFAEWANDFLSTYNSH